MAVQESQIKSPLEKHHADAVVNFLLRIACQVRVEGEGEECHVEHGT